MTRLIPNTAPAGKEIATLAGGCFWCLEAVYDQLKGVEAVESGYTGGQVANPASYRNRTLVMSTGVAFFLVTSVTQWTRERQLYGSLILMVIFLVDAVRYAVAWRRARQLSAR